MDYMQAQAYILTLLAFMFGPLLPQLFLYGFLGMIILDQTVRLRIAYSVKRFPKYDDSINQTTILLISYGAYLYALVGSWLYSN